jgi:hypothetical protein
MDTRRSGKRKSTLFIVVLAIVSFFMINQWVNYEISYLGRAELISGYSLFAIFIFLSLFNLRKRLSVVPQIGRVYWWHQIHIIFGVLTVLIYALHVDSWWPQASYERWIAVFFYMVFLSGVLGFWFQIKFPRMLTENREEIIFERIPDAVSELKEASMSLVDQAVREEGSDTILRLYQDYLATYFIRPRSTFNILLGNHRNVFEIVHQIDATARFCNANELILLKQLKELVTRKSRIDRQYAYQLAMKLWLFIHIPAVTGLILFTFWHLMLVNIYSV